MRVGIGKGEGRGLDCVENLRCAEGLEESLGRLRVETGAYGRVSRALTNGGEIRITTVLTTLYYNTN